jgi:NAD(P)-dependent dehydrogenase (short-subunit alcohol dehydrogenase family)
MQSKMTVETFGQLDILVNNTGTAIPKSFDETTLEEMDRVIDLNLRGVLIATHAALKHLKSGGRIISIGSCMGERMMTPRLVAYSATKGASKCLPRSYPGRWENGALPSIMSKYCGGNDTTAAALFFSKRFPALLRENG